MDWQREVVELHEFFGAWFRGELPPGDIVRFERVLDPGFVIVGPDGRVTERAAIIDAVARNAGRSRDIEIRVDGFTEIADLGRAVVGQYHEHQAVDGELSERISTAVFADDRRAPNRVRWITVHETWLQRNDS